MTQTSPPRRLILRPDEVRELVRCGSVTVVRSRPRQDLVLCPFGVPGSLLWVAETWDHGDGWYPDEPRLAWKNCRRDGKCTWVDYRASWQGCRSEGEDPPRWQPPVCMPHWASRLTVRVGSVEVEREGDAWQWRVRVEREGEGVSDGE